MAETKVLKTSEEALKEALQLLREGKLVAFPTDTVYGVGAHAFLKEAVERIYTAKLRPKGKAIPLLLGRAEDMELVAQEVPPAAWKLAERFWPGGLTIVLRKKPIVPDVVSAGGETVALRVPDHPFPLSLIASLGAPLAATSANLAGRPSPVTAQEVSRELAGRIELIVDGGPCPGGIPSTVLDLTVDHPAILRHGAVPKEDLLAMLK
ncbi:MAG: L-threonylcarbamoyladenylate synthase [Anaerolineae bacterium]